MVPYNAPPQPVHTKDPIEILTYVGHLWPQSKQNLFSWIDERSRRVLAGESWFLRVLDIMAAK